MDKDNLNITSNDNTAINNTRSTSEYVNSNVYAVIRSGGGDVAGC